jgi:hypothetical protein
VIRPLALALLLATITACGVAQPPAQLTPIASPHATTLTASQCQVLNGQADRHCTPGALNLDVTQATIHQTICVRGWTATVRPPVSYTDQLKRQQMVQYGETGPPSAFEEDHLIPLEAGGSPTSPSNLGQSPESARTRLLRRTRWRTRCVRPSALTGSP